MFLLKNLRSHPELLRRRSWNFPRTLPKTPYELTTLARSLLLLSFCFVANVSCWIVSGILFGRRKSTRSILSLCLLAWTTGLRHGECLFPDDSAIDNATRNLINLNQLPVTCGLYFSLGHSTIVIVVNVAIAISSDVYDKIGRVGNVGSIVGAAVSGSFLFIIGLANSIILWRLLGRRRRVKAKRLQLKQGNVDNAVREDEEQTHETSGLMMRILGPVTTFVNKPWKMYPVGVLFGFGFDTASSVALIAITALAKKGADGETIPRGSIVILPFLFTAGMILVDSIDSVLMLYSYAGFTERNNWTLIERRASQPTFPTSVSTLPEDDPTQIPESQPKEAAPVAEVDASIPRLEGSLAYSLPTQPRDCKMDIPGTGNVADENGEGMKFDDANIAVSSVEQGPAISVKLNTMSNLSIALTFISILVALSISLITIMGLIGDHCGSCQKAANSTDGGGLAGSWWRGWAKANDNSGFIGAAIVGGFVAIVAGWYATRWIVRRWKRTSISNHYRDEDKGTEKPHL